MDERVAEPDDVDGREPPDPSLDAELGCFFPVMPDEDELPDDELSDDELSDDELLADEPVDDELSDLEEPPGLGAEPDGDPRESVR